MSSLWDDLDKEREKDRGTSGQFVTLQDGEEVVGKVVLSLDHHSPYIQIQHNRPRPFEVVFHHAAGKECDQCDDPKLQTRRRYMFLFVVTDGIGWETKILAGSPRLYDEIRGYDQKGVIEKWLLRYSRTGTGTNTRYKLEKEERLDELSEGDQKAIEAVDLVDIHEACGDAVPF